MPILEVRNLTKIYRSGLWPFKTPQTYTAINNIFFHLKKGEILGFLGPNGAGKTTTIQMLLGTLTPNSGSITYFGKDFTKQRINILKSIGYASGYDKLTHRLSVVENLDLVGRIYGISQPQRREQIEKLLQFFDIWEMRRGVELGFVIGWFFLLFSGAYYPVEVLPHWAQMISTCIPMSYVFTGMREYLMHQQDPTSYLIKGYVLSIFYAVGAMILFIYYFNRSKQKGLARLAE